MFYSKYKIQQFSRQPEIIFRIKIHNWKNKIQDEVVFQIFFFFGLQSLF